MTSRSKNVYATFKIQVKSMLVIKCRVDFRIFQFASALQQQKNCWRLSRNLCMWHRQWLRHALAFCWRLWFENKLKRCFSKKKKKKWGWCKKKTKIDWNTSFNKRFYILMVKVIWWNLLNQINAIIYAVKFETFLFDQI